jgi:hypothetical protein
MRAQMKEINVQKATDSLCTKKLIVYICVF